MKPTMKFLAVMAFFLGLPPRLYPQGYIVPNGVLQFSVPGKITVVNNPAYPIGSGGPYTGFEFLTVNANTFLFNPFVDTGVRVFLVSSNNPISLQAIQTQGYTEFGYAPSYVFNTGTPFYVGLYTGPHLPQNGIYDVNPLFGWAQLVNSNGAIQLLDSALEYGGGGIYAGTQNIIPVPEPNTLVLLTIGGLFLGWYWQKNFATQVGRQTTCRIW